MSFKPEFQVGTDPKFYGNAQAFATEAEALASAQARFNVWTMATGFRAVESDEPVNYRWEDGVGDVPVSRG